VATIERIPTGCWLASTHRQSGTCILHTSPLPTSFPL
jgi:hypothetical protein